MSDGVQRAAEDKSSEFDPGGSRELNCGQRARVKKRSERGSAVTMDYIDFGLLALQEAWRLRAANAANVQKGRHTVPCSRPWVGREQPAGRERAPWSLISPFAHLCTAMPH